MRISDWSSDVCSSDLRGGDDDAVEGRLLAPALPAVAVARGDVVQAELQEARLGSLQQLLEALDGVDAPADARQRSEEHTSELQSLMRISYAVFCLKKKRPKRDK